VEDLDAPFEYEEPEGFDKNDPVVHTSKDGMRKIGI
jgi:hypothetical protein